MKPKGTLMRYRSTLIQVLVVAAIAAVVVVGCGDGDDGGDEGTTTGTDTGTAGTVTIKMGDFFFDPKDATAEAGSVTISAPNEGQVEHELMLLKTNIDPAELPTASDGGVEEKLHEAAEENGEIADVEPGETKSVTFDLTPGKYVMFCDLPAHYAQGMYGSVTVK